MSKSRVNFTVHQQPSVMTRTLSLSDKQFIENQRKLGKSCQWIAESLSIQVRLVYKWTGRVKKTCPRAQCRVGQLREVGQALMRVS